MRTSPALLTAVSTVTAIFIGLFVCYRQRLRKPRVAKLLGLFFVLYFVGLLLATIIGMSLHRIGYQNGIMKLAMDLIFLVSQWIGIVAWAIALWALFGPSDSDREMPRR